MELAARIKAADRIVAFTGAGISTESGIADFRSAGGIYDRIRDRHHTGEEALHVDFLERNSELFFENYRKTLDFPDAKPNFGHQFFKNLEDAGKKVTVVTQNIDHLHEKAGSSNVWPLHGDATKWKVHRTNEPLTPEQITWDEKGIARNERGKLVRPDIVLYGEPLDDRVFRSAWEAIANADLLMVIGTSLSVYPAAGLLDAFSGSYSVLINRSGLAPLHQFDRTFQEDSGKMLEDLWKNILKQEVK